MLRLELTRPIKAAHYYLHGSAHFKVLGEGPHMPIFGFRGLLREQLICTFAVCHLNQDPLSVSEIRKLFNDHEGGIFR